MPRLSRYTPDARMVVAVLAAAYVSAVLFQFVPQIAPAAIAGRLGSGK
jgi:hypothetical protein